MGLISKTIEKINKLNSEQGGDVKYQLSYLKDLMNDVSKEFKNLKYETTIIHLNEDDAAIVLRDNGTLKLHVSYDNKDELNLQSSILSAFATLIMKKGDSYINNLLDEYDELKQEYLNFNEKENDNAE